MKEKETGPETVSYVEKHLIVTVYELNSSSPVKVNVVTGPTVCTSRLKNPNCDSDSISS